jgi:hypothetical protein
MRSEEAASLYKIQYKGRAPEKREVLEIPGLKSEALAPGTLLLFAST